jgi:diketogulonate reductase-like aldo/keto reductase
MRFSDVDYMDTWRALEKAVSDGKVRAIGLSNFNSKQIQRVIDNCKIHPDVLQVSIGYIISESKASKRIHKNFRFLSISV